MQELRGHTVILRQLSHEHISPYLAAFSPLVQSFVHANSQDEFQYLHRILRDEQTHWSYAIFLGDPLREQLIGAVHLNMHADQFFLYGWLNEQYWGKNLYQEAIALVAHAFFSCFPQHHMYAKVDCDNVRSYRSLKKAGFAHVGIQNGPYGLQYVLVLRNRMITQPSYIHIPCLNTGA